MKTMLFLSVMGVMFVVLGAVFDNAYADSCEYKRTIDRSVDLKGLNQLKVEAGAGELKIIGQGDQNQVMIKARLCSSDKDYLQEIDVLSTYESDSLVVKTEFPDKLWRFNNVSRIDLELFVPSSILADVKDSSGRASVSGIAELSMVDSSGQLDIESINGDVEVTDSSGALNIIQIGGSVTVTDSSGSISITDVQNDAVIKSDSSGSIDIARVTNDVLIRRDSSGSIKVQDVGGNFTVGQDGSGGIYYSDVAGEVRLPERSSY